MVGCAARLCTALHKARPDPAWCNSVGVMSGLFSGSKRRCIGKACVCAIPIFGAIHQIVAIGFHLNLRTRMGCYGTTIQLLNQQVRIGVGSSWGLCQSSFLLCKTGTSHVSGPNWCRVCLSSQSDPYGPRIQSQQARAQEHSAASQHGLTALALAGPVERGVRHYGSSRCAFRVTDCPYIFSTRMSMKTVRSDGEPDPWGMTT